MSTNTTDIKDFIQKHKEIIEGFLVKLLPHQTSHRLYAAMQYAVLNNGKRIRPALVYATGQVLNVPIERLHAAAAAIELTHCYSLVHDDLPAMDDDDLRRGMPSCHKAFGEAVAILTGDALQVMAFEVLSDPELNPVEPQLQVAMIAALARASGASGMILGQAEDIEAENKIISLDELAHMHQRKTGALLNACLEVSIIAAGKENDATVRESLLDFGHNIGLAFQIQDDILDETSDDQTLGKPAGSDLAANKSTYTTLLGLEAAQEHAAKALRQAIAALEPLGDDASTLRDLGNYIVSRTA